MIKMIPLLATPGLILVGATKMDVKKYAFWSIVITIPTSLFYLIIGYYFGAAYNTIEHYLNLGIYVAIAAVIVIASLPISKENISPGPREKDRGRSRITCASPYFRQLSIPKLSGISDSVVSLAKTLAARGHFN